MRCELMRDAKARASLRPAVELRADLLEALWSLTTGAQRAPFAVRTAGLSVAGRVRSRTRLQN
ncbi:hypothetical protein XFF6166_390092 [Xanthomonas citri pv. fuscans]|nr:hypothetical protein XFF6166_390092 [Xanthomonas citri pv. fuscans]SON99928.1 hypothetical protein XFF6960_210091 [Xanthomonas citri pv. fuscans]SOO03359.1 hypothetical protein XFF7767_160031 [Xanthomonas citri pv. fuscans]SOO10502.1 hypothetical protein XFF6970_570092 [Xanthomonas citri pv. fuscans]SOO15114.1 hypothetical protein XFF7766_470092 [Xanthomonas citri pv. fuscans]